MIAAVALALAQAAAPAAPQTGPTVVVTGRRDDRAKSVRHMTARVAAVGDASQPLARFAGPICPAAIGIPTAVAARLTARIRSDAKNAGIVVDREGCAPNISILFVPNGQEVVRGLWKRRPDFFGAMEPDRIRHMAADPSPVHLWSFTEIRSRDDDRPRQGTTLPGLDAPELQVRGASIINATTRIVVDGAIMLIDQPAAIGKTIDQLADYAAMRILGQARPIGSDGGEATILRLFDAGITPPRALTPFDTAYLKAFYQGQPTQLPFSRVGTMARSINQSLSQAVAAPDGGSPRPAP